MSSGKLSERKAREIEEIAAVWGKLLAQEAFPDGPGLDVTLADMEELAARACRAMVRGTVETMTGQQAKQLGEEAACPTCQRMCPVKKKSRRVVVRGGEAILDEPVCHCPACRRDFFPQRPLLRLDGHGYSATVLHRILHVASVTSAFEVAETALKVVGEITISARQINNLANEIGQELAADRDARTEEYVNQPLPRQPRSVDVPPDLAAVFLDGGRMRTREPEQGRGVHQPHWRETKNAGFHRMKSQSFAEDPQPELPDCFRNEAYVEKLVKGLKSLKKAGREEELDEEQPSPSIAASAEASPQKPASWQPETLFRTCLSSLASSEEFGAMMATEADARGFYTAKKRAFLGDGQSYNWTIQRQWFPGFVAVADFVHPVEYAYTVAKTVHTDAACRWRQYVEWVTACWKGDVAKVIADLVDWQSRLGPLPEGEKVAENDPRKIIHSALTYFTNNSSRMDYPCYRREGLPVTSSLAESLVKQISKRVKGTEKFWNDGPSGEAILQLRAGVISDDDRLQRWICNRPISPFSPRCRMIALANSP